MNQATIILVHVGPSQLPSHLLETFEITCRVAKKSRIVILANEKNRNHFNEINARLEPDEACIQFVSIESIPQGQFTQKFQDTSVLDRAFRGGFWFNASNRFFVLADYIEHAGIENIIHIENDYVLYFDPTDKINSFRTFADFAVPLDRIRAIPGMVWIKNAKAANSLARHISQNSHQDDMTSLGHFCVKNNELVARPLPTIPYGYATKKGLDTNRYSEGVDLFGGIFDAAAIGQYIAGVHWMNDPGDTTFFVNESSDLNLSNFSFSWGIKNQIKHPTLSYENEKIAVLGMHAHSKSLAGVSPFNHGLPLNNQAVITGERIQALCEITISSTSVTKFHGRSNIQSKELVELSEDAQGNLIPPSNEMIARVSQASSIFVYTHLVPYFKYYFAPRINSFFTLVTHNSDHPVTIFDFEMLNHPYLLSWFSQNCEFSHSKLKPLPIGVQNQQWGIEKIDQLIGAGKCISKSSLLYVNFSVQTHPSRNQALSILSELKQATIESDVSYTQYLKGLAMHKFCICPRGNGIDTHRFWEAQYLDCIPIILLKDWTPSYSGMPILIVHSWADLKELDLEGAYIKITNKKYLRTNLDLNKLKKEMFQS